VFSKDTSLIEKNHVVWPWEVARLLLEAGKERMGKVLYAGF
jgi:hypothetical protein